MSDDPWNQKPSEELGSLAQSARQSSLKQARVILIVVGVLTILVNLFGLMNIDNEIREVQRQHPGIVISEEVVRVARLIYIGSAGLGVVFVILGITVYSAPLVCTVTGLVLYLGGIAVFAVLEPESIIRGIIIKIFIIIGLVKAVQAAAAYEREVKAERQSNQSRDSFE